MTQDPISLRHFPYEVLSMQYVKLCDLATIKFCSITPSRAKQQAISSKWLVCANFLADNEIDSNPIVNYVVPDEEWLLHKDDIVIKRITPTFINYIGYCPDDVYCGNNLIIVTPNKETDAKFLAMILNDKIGELSKESSIGAVMKSISRQDLEMLEIPLPEEYKRRLLGELWYNAIELKKKRIKLAELENIRTTYIIKKTIHTSGGK